MNINDLLKTIRDYIEEYRSIEYKSFKTNQNRHQDEDFMSELHIQVDDEKLWYDRVITETIQDLQKKSISENYYFFDCAFEVYKNHYEARKKEFLENHVDVNEADFLKEELLDRIQGGNNRVLFVEEKTVFYDNFIESEKKLFNSERKKVEFLLHKLELLGWDAVYIFDKDNMPLTYQFEKNNNYQSPFLLDTANKDTMKSEQIVKHIAKKIFDFKKYDKIQANRVAMDIEKEADNKIIVDLLMKLYYQSVEDNFYWFDCPKRVYEKTIEKRFKEHKIKYIDADFQDFLQSEMDKLEHYDFRYRYLIFDEKKVSYSDFITYDNDVIGSSLEKKKQFILDKLKDLETKDTTASAEQPIIQKPTVVGANNEKSNKIKWSGKPSQLGYFVGILTSLDYMEAPKKSNGEINFSAFARQILENFEIETTPGSLAKYLNIDSEKAQEIARKLKEDNFHIPHSKTIS
ncbi:MAG: hypothetical protein ACTH6S_03950 [Mesonia sp.]|uniref:hypothetical protein n=1 Tax=Mesonia sp. TaxID=1960830 RepID=UPI003F9BEA32